jgi:glutathione synthase/RimK-type ligase-like ATP-grasp enzyme
MKKSVIILSKPDDSHAIVVARKVRERDVDCQILDSGSFATGLLHGKIGNGTDTATLQWGDVTIDSSTTVWWRRVYPPPPDPRIWEKEIRRFVACERADALFGMLHATGCRVVNNPFSEKAALYKPLQLQVAKDVGLNIPETCITNDANIARRFAENLNKMGKRCVYKGLGPVKYHPAETRVLQVEDLNDQEVAITPIIFQECIERGIDIRCTFVNDQLFHSTVESQHEELVDWRLDILATHQEYSLSPDHEEKLKQLMKKLGLVYGAIDLRIDPDGLVYFFEVNPTGQFLFIEGEVDLPISDVLADVLIGE